MLLRSNNYIISKENLKKKTKLYSDYKNVLCAFEIKNRCDSTQQFKGVDHTKSTLGKYYDIDNLYPNLT